MKTFQRQLPHLSDAPETSIEVAIPEHDLPSGLSMLQLFTIARHYWKQSALIAAVMIVVLTVFIKLLPKSYTATATLIVNSARENPLPDQPVGNDLPDYVATQAELIGSSAVLLPVVDRLKLTADPAFARGASALSPAEQRDYAERNLAASLQVDVGRGGQLIEISITTDRPDKSAAIADAVADVYLQEDRDRANQPVSEQAALSSQQLSQLRSNVNDAQAKVTAFRDKFGLTSLAGESVDSEAQALQTLQQRLLETQNERRTLEAQQSGNIENANEALSSPGVGSLRAEEASLEAKLAELRPTLGPRHPQIVGLEAQLRETQRSLRMELDALSGNIGTQLSRTRALETELTQAVAAQRTKLLQLRQVQDQGSKLQLELQSAQTVYKQALDSFDQVKFDTVHNFANVSLVSHAAVPVRPSKPKKMQLLGLAVLASLGAGIALPFFYELWVDRRVRCRDDLERGLGIRVLAEMDQLPLLSEDV